MKSYYTLLVILFQLLFSLPELLSQCFENSHNSSLENVWLSCSSSSSPNPSREKGHWALYEFDEEKRVTGFQFWNINHPEYLTSGSKTIAVDYRDQDGEWKNHDTFTMIQGDGRGYYEGESYQMLEHVISDQILIYVLSNHGGPCTGLAEVKFNVLSSTTPTEDIAENHFDILISPNPFNEITSVSIGGLENREITYELIDNTGKVIQNRKARTISGKAQFEIKAENIPSGNYYLKISDGIRVSSRKLVLQNL